MPVSPVHSYRVVATSDSAFNHAGIRQAACAANGNFNATLPLKGMLASPTGPGPRLAGPTLQKLRKEHPQAVITWQDIPSPRSNPIYRLISRHSFDRVSQPDSVVLPGAGSHTPPRPHQTSQPTVYNLTTIMTQARQTISLGLLVSSVRFSAHAKQPNGRALRSFADTRTAIPRPLLAARPLGRKGPGPDRPGRM